jgi:hypothetical protein
MTGATPDFVDSLTQRFVANYENQLPRSMLCCPGYANGGTQTTIAPANVTFARLNAGTNDTLEWLSDGYSGVLLAQNVVVVAGTAAGTSQWGIGIDSIVNCAIAAQVAAAAVNVNAPCHYATIPNAGYHFAAMLAATGLGATFACDLVRAGSAADPIATHLAGFVLA